MKKSRKPPFVMLLVLLCFVFLWSSMPQVTQAALPACNGGKLLSLDDFSNSCILDTGEYKFTVTCTPEEVNNCLEKLEKWLNEILKGNCANYGSVQKYHPLRNKQITPDTTPDYDPGSEPDQQVEGLTADEQEMVDLVNSERKSAGLPALKVNLDLVKIARLKAEDMIENNYFSHTSPTYGSPFDMMSRFGISYRTAGENLAGAPTVESAHENLMNSAGHRANILNSSFKEIGIGVVEGSQYGKIFVQEFIG
ncbi:MAG: CAP domain-containing protein [Eubacteriales bacterium]